MQVQSKSEMQFEKLSRNDFKQLIDLRDFEFTKNPEGCKEMSHQPLIIVLVHSASNNFNRRRAIRETWGGKDARAVLLFVVGLVNSVTLQEEMDLENEVHKDLLQGNFYDSYRNLTYKHVMALKWFVYNCPNVGYLLKTDDDAFVNTPLLYSYLKKSTSSSEIFCNKIVNPTVRRDPDDKWHVPHDEYSEKFYPDYCQGLWILYPANIVFRLYQQAQKLSYFWIDDVHITVGSSLKIHINPSSYLMLSEWEQRNLLSGCVDAEAKPFFFAEHNISEKEIRKLWKIVKYS